MNIKYRYSLINKYQTSQRNHAMPTERQTANNRASAPMPRQTRPPAKISRPITKDNQATDQNMQGITQKPPHPSIHPSRRTTRHLLSVTYAVVMHLTSYRI